MGHESTASSTDPLAISIEADSASRPRAVLEPNQVQHRG
jgi:hypothetical protein